MDMKDVKGSSQVTAVGYDVVTRILQVRFTNGAEYQYAGVPPDLYEKLIAAPSFGSFLHKHIKGKYQYQKITEPAPKS